ncbi:hypothetical protein MUK42_21412 [Musa troglodytarum]|uniref:Uncharacterized protein n=1 Tax=Musa troglodytarum TaxID=320322 RepID=A0A9E7G341_9LILI|nr:hypothetical protein MUK42_21412 [Musa troglodytarum]
MSPLIGETPIFTAAAVDPARGALRLVVVAIAPAGGAIAEIFDQVIEKKFSDSDLILVVPCRLISDLVIVIVSAIINDITFSCLGQPVYVVESCQKA